MCIDNKDYSEHNDTKNTEKEMKEKKIYQSVSTVENIDEDKEKEQINENLNEFKQVYVDEPIIKLEVGSNLKHENGDVYNIKQETLHKK